MAESDITPFIAVVISCVLLSMILFILRFRRLENQNPLDRKVFNFDVVWRKIQYVFWPLIVSLTIVFIITNWNDQSTLNSKIADTLSVVGFFISIYIAMWAYLVEYRKRYYEEQENIYYKLNLNDVISNLLSMLNFIFKWTEPWQRNETVRNAFCNNIIIDLCNNRKSIFATCVEIQTMNLNPHIPADIKDHVYVIMTQSRKVISSEPTVLGLPSYYGIVNDVYSRIQKLYETEYMKDINEIREKFRSDIIQNLNP